MTILLIFPIINFVIDVILVTLNIKHQQHYREEFPIDNQKYNLYISYSTRKQQNKLISLFVKLLYIILLVAFLYEYINEISTTLFSQQILQSLFTLLILYSLYQLVESLYEIVDTFTTETAFGFNKASIKSFFKDQLIDYIVSSIMLVCIGYLFLLLYTNYNNYFLIGGFVLIVVFQVLYHSLFVILFMPLLFKFEPLENNDIKDKIQTIAEKEGFSLDDIMVAKASEKTTKLNAMFSGFGKSKKVMLFDTVLDSFTTDQIVSIISHEIGHSKNKDMFFDMMMDILKMAIYFLVYVFLLYNSLTTGLVDSLLYFLILLPFLQKVIRMMTNYVSRYHEKRADLYVKHIGYGKELMESLTIAAKTNMSNINPHPLFTFLKADHPPYLTRMNYLK